MSHLTSTIGGELPLRPDLGPVVELATGILRELAEPHDHLDIAAHWTTARDTRGGLKLVLRLRDPHADASAAFSPADLTGPGARSLLSRVYRSLLRERVQHLLAASEPSTAAAE